MARLRTFIAIDPGKTIRDRIIGLQEKLARNTDTDVKWVEAENLHVTMLFLGEVDERVINDVCRAVADVTRRHAPFLMSIEKVGCFPNPRRPRVLWVGVGQGSAQISELHDELEVPLLDLGCYRREVRKYTPHITLGRVKTDRPADQLAAALAQQTAWKAGEIAIREILVMNSELTSRGPIYAVLSRAKLSESNEK